jgi:hypothetical protein
MLLIFKNLDTGTEKSKVFSFCEIYVSHPAEPDD